ncbi:MAG: hypothetical protein R3F43_10570 [bacterium]
MKTVGPTAWRVGELAGTASGPVDVRLPLPAKSFCAVGFQPPWLVCHVEVVAPPLLRGPAALRRRPRHLGQHARGPRARPRRRPRGPAAARHRAHRGRRCGGAARWARRTAWMRPRRGDGPGGLLAAAAEAAPARPSSSSPTAARRGRSLGGRPRRAGRSARGDGGGG